MSARDEILARVRTAIAGATPTQPPPRDYRTTTADDLDTFLDRLAHYDATTHVIDAADVDRVVSTTLSGRTIVVPDGIPETWLTDVQVLPDDPPLTNDQIDQSQGVLTTCALAIAQTGTIVLDGGPGMGRRALTLLPDYHLCVVRHDQIVSSVPEAIAQLNGNPTRPITFISGPSATVDIEMTRVRGVHGPRNLEVIVTTAAQSEQET
jgi:L-lactate dehydrogenase complex protein LldG